MPTSIPPIPSFTTDAVNRLLNLTRSGTLTVSGRLTEAVTSLGSTAPTPSSTPRPLSSPTEGLTLHDGNNLVMTFGSHAAAHGVLSTITTTRLPLSCRQGPSPPFGSDRRNAPLRT